MGVILYMMLSSDVPFPAKRSKNMRLKILKGRYSMEGPVWDNTSNGAKHLTTHLLEKDATKRYTAKDVLEHIWVKKWSERSDVKPQDDILDAIGDSLRQYKQTSTLKKLALNVSHRQCGLLVELPRFLP
jgi:serine/threonine protein kinase